jgi:choline dehydrogenase-like flavoprotein
VGSPSWPECINLTACGSPYFLKSETFQPPSPEHQAESKLFYDRAALGTTGPLRISYAREHAQSHRYWHDTLHNLGAATNMAHVGGSNVGVWTNLGTVDQETQTRSYSYNAYYLPSSHRPNLTVLTEAVALEVVLDRTETGGWAAKGVKFAHGGTTHVVPVQREVIVAAGTIQSPQILELSGIGNPEILRAAGVEVKVENPNVGENLQDHLSKFLPTFLLSLSLSLSLTHTHTLADHLLQCLQPSSRWILLCGIQTSTS